MIITISGKAGSGKSTIAKLVSQRLNLRHYSTGDLYRQIAKEKGVSIIDLGKLAEKDKSIDEQLDERQKELGKKDNFVIDGRLSAFFIPHAKLRVFLKAEDKVRADRILKDRRQDEHNKNIQETMQSIEKRESSERKRYKSYYNVDYCDESLYNLVIDTTKLSINEVVGRVIQSAKIL